MGPWGNPTWDVLKFGPSWTHGGTKLGPIMGGIHVWALMGGIMGPSWAGLKFGPWGAQTWTHHGLGSDMYSVTLRTARTKHSNVANAPFWTSYFSCTLLSTGFTFKRPTKHNIPINAKVNKQIIWISRCVFNSKRHTKSIPGQTPVLRGKFFALKRPTKLKTP